MGLVSTPFFLSINTTWLERLGLEMPETLEEFANVLRAFRDQDPNGNGIQDEIPFSFMFDWWCWTSAIFSRPLVWLTTLSIAL